MTPLRAARVTLCPMEEAHRSAVLAILRDPVVARTYMVPEITSQEIEEKLFRHLWSLTRSRERFAWAVCCQGELIGFVHEVERQDDWVELGWALHPLWHGQGFATEAVCAAIEAMFAQGVAEVRAGAFESNPASIRVMEKCGMQPIGLTEQISYRGQQHRCVYRSIRRQEKS